MKVEGESSSMILFFGLIRKSITLGASALIVITVPFLSGADFNYRPSPWLICGSWHHLFPIVSIKEGSVCRDNKRTGKHASCSFSFLASMNTVFDLSEEQYWLLFCGNRCPQIPTDSIPLWPIQESNLALKMFLFLLSYEQISNLI